MEKFNLVDDSWVPAIEATGNQQIIGLLDLVVGAHEIMDMSVDILERIAVTRLLVAIAQAAIDGPKNTSDWIQSRDLWQSAALDYLDQWRPSFNLFGDGRRFLQTPDLGAQMTNATDKLDFRRVSGNNTTWRDHDAQDGARSNTPEWLAMGLLVFQLVARCGTIGSVELNGRKTARTANAAPVSEGNMLHTITVGSNLGETIWLNMVPVDRLGTMPMGRPVWESMPETVDSENALAESYLGRLVPLSRAIRLADDGKMMSVAEWIRYPQLPAGRDPFGTVLATGDNARPLKYQATQMGVHAWRHIPSILSMALVAEGIQGGVLSLENLHHINDLVTIWTGGMDAYQASVYCLCDWSLTVPPAVLESAGFAAYSDGVSLAEKTSGRLSMAIKRYGQDNTKQAKDQFWGILNEAHTMLFELAEKRDVGPWSRVVVDTARKIFDKTCRPSSAGEWTTWANARQIITIKHDGGE
jgi:CRISPR system Cascade subunit CasA